MRGDWITALLIVAMPFLSHAQQPKVYEITHIQDTSSLYFVETPDLYEERIDTLAHPQFWRKVMLMSPDSCYINIAKTREILLKVDFNAWAAQTEPEKDIYRDSVRKMFNLPDSTRLYVTSGKNNFYLFDKVMPSVTKGIEIFKQENTDPWYAQAILLIESPGKIAYSNVGAFGPFQLMPSVARTRGLTVNRHLDERKDFDKSAVVAADLIRNTCIPEAKRLLKKYNITWDPDALWSKLFVLHIYHAGAGNVSAVLDAIQPSKGNIDLIQTMWNTEAGQFKNASQNYSQLALATAMIIEEMMYEDCLYLYDCTD